MPKTAEELILLLQNPQDMKKEDVKELSNYLRLIERKGSSITPDEKVLYDMFWQTMETYARKREQTIEDERNVRESEAEKYYRNVYTRIKDASDKKAASTAPAELAKKPYDRPQEAVLEQGRYRGKGRIAYLLETYRPLADADEELKALLEQMEAYVKTDANATSRLRKVDEEIQKLKDLCQKSEDFLKNQEKRQLDPVLGDSEEGQALFAAANDINQFLLIQRDGDLDVSRPYRAPIDPKTGSAAWEEPEPETVDSSGDWIKMRAKIGSNGVVKSDKELDKADEPLFPHDPSPMDVSQGRLGDCYLLASLASLAANHPEKIREMMTDNGDGTVTVRFFKKEIDKYSGELTCYRPILVTVDKTVPEQGGAQDALWVSVIERAFAAADLHTGHNVTQGVQRLDAAAWDTYSHLKMLNTGRMTDAEVLEDEIRSRNARELYPYLFDSDGKLRTDLDHKDYSHIASGSPHIFLEQVLGPEGEGEVISVDDIISNGKGIERDKDNQKIIPTPDANAVAKVGSVLKTALDQHSLVTAGTHGDSDDVIEDGLFDSHAYSVLAIGTKTVDGITDTFVTVRNPHGVTGRRYINDNGVLKPEEWKDLGGVFDIRLSDFAREFTSISVNHCERTVLPEKSSDPLKHPYFSLVDEIRYRMSFQAVEKMYDRASPIFSQDEEFKKLHNYVSQCITHLNEEQGHSMTAAANSEVHLITRRACERFLTARQGNMTDKQKDAVKMTLELLDSMQKGYAEPRDAYREAIVEKILTAQCERKCQSADEKERREGEDLRKILTDPNQKTERDKKIYDMARNDETINYLMGTNPLADIRSLANDTKERLADLYDQIQPKAQAAFARKSPAAPQALPIPANMKLYYGALKDLRTELLATDKNLPESYNSPEYRALRTSLNEYLDSLTDPESAGKTRREFARTEKAEALRKACEKYKTHCDATPKEKKKPRRIRRVQQMKNIEYLLNGLEKNVFADPRDYMRMQLAEKAASALIKESAAEEKSNRANALEARNRDKQIVSFYGEPGFADFSKKVSFARLAEMMNMDAPDLANFCNEQAEAWKKWHPTKEQRLERSKNRRLFEMIGNGKKPVYSIRKKEKTVEDPTLNAPAVKNP